MVGRIIVHNKLQVLLVTWVGCLSACTDIVVQVKKKDKGNGGFSSDQQAVVVKDDPEIRDLEFYLSQLDSVRESSPDHILNKIDRNWRTLFRRDFRIFRDSMVEAATRQHSYQEGLYFNTDQDACNKLESIDLKANSNLENISSTLEASFIGFAQPKALAQVNPDLEDSSELFAQLILFELGMNAHGEATSEVIDDVTKTKALVRWKVNPEFKDSSEEQDHNSKLGVLVHFERSLSRGSPVDFQLIVKIGEGIYEDKPVGPIYRLELTTRWEYPSIEGKRIQTVFKTFVDNRLNYSRSLSVNQLIKGGSLYLARDTIFYDLPEEKSRTITLDFDKLEKCDASTVSIEVPGIIGMTRDQAFEKLKELGIDQKLIRDLTEGDPSAVIVDQFPVAGSPIKIGEAIEIILGTPAESLIEKLKEDKQVVEDSSSSN